MFRWVTDVSRGDWVGPRLGPFGGGVGSTVPRGYEAYARVLHRAPGPTGGVRWSEVAAATGTVLHPTAQWWRVARRPEVYTQAPFVAHDAPWPDGRVHEGDPWVRRGEPHEWPGGNPPEGELDREQLAALVAVLRGFTDPDALTAAFWSGSSWEGGQVLAVWVPGRRAFWWRVPALRRVLMLRQMRRVGRDLPTGPDIDPAVLAGPRLELPAREHFLLAGSLDDVAALAAGTATADVSPFRPGSRTPSLLWPDDRTWCVATEVDFDSTLVGGTRDLVDAVLADPVLEAVAVGPDDSLGDDDDPVNR